MLHDQLTSLLMQFASKRLPFGLLLILSAAVLFFAERTEPSIPWLWVQGAGLIALLGYLYLLYHSQREVLFTSFYQTFYWIGILASAAAISSGAHMLEIDKTGTANGAFWVALGFFVAGMEATVLGYRAGARSLPGTAINIPILNKLALAACIGGALALSAFVFAFYGGPILAGTDRVTFYMEITPRLLAYTPTIVTQAFFFAAFFFMAAVRDGKSRILPALIVIGFIASGYFVLGQKFSLYIIYANAWLFLVAALLPDFRLRRRHVALVLAVAIGAVFVVGWTYMRDGREFSFILDRVALQAQLLWSVIGSGATADWSCFFGCDGSATGQEFISRLYLPSHRFNHYQQTGTALSGFNPALPLLTFGLFVTAALFLVASVALGWLQRKAVEAFRRDNMVYGFLIFKAQLGVSTMVATGSLSPVWGVLVALFAACLWRVASLILQRHIDGMMGTERTDYVQE